MKTALDAIRSAEANLKALTYAPWVMSLFVVFFIREKMNTLDLDDWVKIGVFVCALPVLGRLAQGQLHKQKVQSEEAVARLVRSSPRGLQEYTRLQASPRYQQLKLGGAIQHAVLGAAMAQEKRDEERRVQAERAEGERLAQPARPGQREPALSGR